MINWLVAVLQLAPIAITCPPVASIAQRPKTVCVARSGQILTPQIRFTPDHRAIHQRSRPIIDELATLLNSLTIQKIAIHTHDQTPDQYGYSRTARWARVLVDALVERGVPRHVIKARSLGEERPMVSRRDPTAPWVNTRVDVWVVGVDAVGGTLLRRIPGR